MDKIPIKTNANEGQGLAVEFVFEDWLKQGAIIGKAGKWAEIHWGPPQSFKKESEINGTAFYKTDFFRTPSKPWLQFPHSQRLEWKVWRDRVGKYLKAHPLPVPQKIKWEDPDKKNFEKVFKSIKKEIQSKNIIKAVPVVSGRCEKTFSSFVPILSGLQQNPKNTYIHGLWTSEDEGFLGFSPEILFLCEKDNRIKTMALAGTRSRKVDSPDPEEFLRDPKEQKEHQIVVQDILAQLSTLGKAKHSKTGLLELDYLIHLYTPLQVVAEVMPSFEDLVKLLHPTPALGVSPRSQFSLLKEWREGSTFLGSPFGIRWSEQNFLCLVAIRNIRWDKSHYFIDNGCGVVEESQMEDEWRELKLKRDSVKKVFKL